MPVIDPHQEFQDLLLAPITPEDITQSSIRTQVILTEYQGQSLAFQSNWVDEVLFIPRDQLYSLPFYGDQLIGLFPRQGKLIPIVHCGDVASQQSRKQIQENIRAMRLSAVMGDLQGVAVMVDKIIGTMDIATFEQQTELKLFAPEHLSPDIFQPKRWA